MRTLDHDATAAYINNTFVDESPLLAEVREHGNIRVPGMQISAHEGAMLQLFARMVNAQHIVEIGTFVGYSTLWLADTLPDDGTLITLESDATHAAIAREHFSKSAHQHKITVIEGDALESLHTLTAQPSFTTDLVFIDAAKAEYGEYFELLHPCLCPGGLIIADNTLLFGHMIGQPKQRASKRAVEAMRNFNAMLAQHPDYDALMLATQEGLNIALKRR